MNARAKKPSGFDVHRARQEVLKLAAQAIREQTNSLNWYVTIAGDDEARSALGKAVAAFADRIAHAAEKGSVQHLEQLLGEADCAVPVELLSREAA